MIVIALYLVELFLGYKYPKSKIAAFFSILLMWILYSFNTYTGDYLGYYNIYSKFVDTVSSGSFSFVNYEPGWSITMLIPALTKMTYAGFRVFAGTVFVILLIYVVSNLTSDIALALAVFSIFPFTHSMSVMRFGFAALVFVAFAFHYIKGDKSIKSKILFFIGVIAATMFHYSMIFFVAFYFATMKINKKVIIGIIAITVVLFIVMRSDIPYNVFTSVDLPHFSTLARKWLSHSSAPGKLSLGMFALGFTLDMYLSVLSAKRNLGSELSKCVERMYIISIIFIPLVATTDQFTRLYHGMFLFNICSAVNTLDVCCQGEGNKLSIKKLITDPYIVVLFVAIAKFLLSDFVYFGTENEGIRCLGQNLLLNLI